jgi:hypothetical protein
MAINYIPRSQIVENKKAQIGEWVYKKTGIPFLGKYHLIKGKPFAGANFLPTKKQQPLEKTSESKLFKILTTSGPNSPAYLMAIGNPGGIGTLVSVAVAATPIVKGVISDSGGNSGIRVFVQKTNVDPKTIKEIKDHSLEYIVTSSNPFYRSVSIFWKESLTPESSLNEADKIIPGIRLFLELS